VTKPTNRKLVGPKKWKSRPRLGKAKVKTLKSWAHKWKDGAEDGSLQKSLNEPKMKEFEER